MSDTLKCYDETVTMNQSFVTDIVISQFSWSFEKTIKIRFCLRLCHRSQLQKRVMKKVNRLLSTTENKLYRRMCTTFGAFCSIRLLLSAICCIKPIITINCQTAAIVWEHFEDVFKSFFNAFGSRRSRTLNTMFIKYRNEHLKTFLTFCSIRLLIDQK